MLLFTPTKMFFLGGGGGGQVPHCLVASSILHWEEGQRFHGRFVKVCLGEEERNFMLHCC